MLRIVLTIFFLTLSLSLANSMAGTSKGDTANRQLLVKASRIIFLGDTTTHEGTYVANFELWLKAFYSRRTIDVINLGLPTETILELTRLEQSKGDTAPPNLFTRLDSILNKSKPSLIFANYGMNCGIYKRFSPERFSAYQMGIEKLKQKAESHGSQIIFITPAFFNSPSQATHCVEAMKKYSQWLVSRRNDGWMVIDAHSHMVKPLDPPRKRLTHLSSKQGTSNANILDHWPITQSIIQWFNDPQSAQSTSASEILELHKLPAGIESLIQQRMLLKRNAWLNHTQSTPLDFPLKSSLATSAPTEAALTKEINRLVKLSN